jgi:hypothetical protein
LDEAVGDVEVFTNVSVGLIHEFTKVLILGVKAGIDKLDCMVV